MKAFLSAILLSGSLFASWQGYYYGELECDNCKSVNTWLRLVSIDGKDYFEQREKFLGVQNRFSSGALLWEETDKIAILKALKSQRKIYFDGDMISYEKNATQTLRKVHAFNAGEDVLLILPQSTKHGLLNGEDVVSFSALLNFKNMREGYKSYKAKYKIYCGQKSYDMLNQVFYKRRFGYGGNLEKIISKDKLMVKDNPFIQQVYEKYCF